MMKNRTFFCSELVAKCYKVMGIMDNDQVSSKYLPKHFSKKHENKLRLLNDVKFGDETLICKTSD